jgi:Endosomal/lysosomal potassium channel TMEM175
MREEVTAHRLAAYSDAVFAVIVTIMVLELRAPDQAAFSALWPLWPTAIITGEPVSATRFHMFWLDGSEHCVLASSYASNPIPTRRANR